MSLRAILLAIKELVQILEPKLCNVQFDDLVHFNLSPIYIHKLFFCCFREYQLEQQPNKCSWISFVNWPITSHTWIIHVPPLAIALAHSIRQGHSHRPCAKIVENKLLDMPVLYICTSIQVTKLIVHQLLAMPSSNVSKQTHLNVNQ